MSSADLHAFPYDPFQHRAIQAIDRGTSLLVAAPTGSGKTVLAEYVIERAFDRRERVIYTAPIKALSNQKFRDFSARHGDQVGIMTGDVTINRQASLMIMTTEIYRNTLLEDPERLDRYAWVIFDEVHFLDDPERGTVWEEAILFTPPHIRLLCLSATVPNVHQLAEWMRLVHQQPVEVIEKSHRPVPLSTLFQCQNQVLKTPQDLKDKGYQGREDWREPRRRYGRYAHHHHSHSPRPNRLEPLVTDLQEQQRLPCILFSFGRRRVEDLAVELSGFTLVTPAERAALRAMYDELCERFQLTADRTAEAMSRLIDRGVAYHHAGMLPTMKEVIERCFTSRQLKLIVTTETFALGVNMPARSVILDSLQKRMGGGYELLRRRDFLQMSGRAGRRGMDEAGFVYLRVNPVHVTYHDVMHLLHGKPEPVTSRFNMAYAALLNLYRRHGRNLLELFPKTLYAFQNSGRERQAGLDLMTRKLDLLNAMQYTSKVGLTEKGEFASWVYGYELLLAELHERAALESLDPIGLAVLMAGIVYEPRPAAPPPKAHRLSKHLNHICQAALATIHRAEHGFQIAPRTKSPAFHLSYAMEAWMHNQPFAKVSKLAEVDEGEIVRYFRMAVQLLRQLWESPASGDDLKSHAEKAFRRINRDVIDAEAQLRMG